MWPDRVSNPGPLTYESGAVPIALRGPASITGEVMGCRDYNKVVFDLVQHYKTVFYASLVQGSPG